MTLSPRTRKSLPGSLLTSQGGRLSREKAGLGGTLSLWVWPAASSAVWERPAECRQHWPPENTPLHPKEICSEP